MKPETRVLRVVQPDNGGPRKRNILDGIARMYGGTDKTVDGLIADRRLVKYSDKRHALWGLPRPPGRPRKQQAGFGLLVNLVLILAVLGALYGLFLYVDAHWETSAGVKKGETQRQALWDKANLKAEAERRAREQDVSDAIKEKEAQLAIARQRADDAHTQWKEAKRETDRKGTALAVCPAPAADQPGAAPASPAAGAAGGGVRFTWDFVRLYDGAWTGADGKPVFQDPAGGAGTEGAGAASPYTPGELLDVHGDNADTCSADRREFSGLIEKLRKAEKAWDGKRPP